MATAQSSRIPTAIRRSLRRNTRRCVLEVMLAGRLRQAQRPAPDFVIIGAQRCGTTSLFRALAQHPAMMSNVIDAKGVHYFDTSYNQSDNWYFAHFPSEAEREAHSEKVESRAIVGEASPYYLFHPSVAERMARTIPNTKIIVLLRDPVKRAISHHLHMIWEGHEPIVDLDYALDLERERLYGIDELLRSDEFFVSRPHQHYSYLARGHYALQLERLYSNFGRENVLVMCSETLIGDSKASLSKIQSFIGLEPDASLDFGKRNASSKYEPKPETVKRLADEYVESNKRLRDLVDIEIPWI